MRAAVLVGLLSSCGLAGCFSSLQEGTGVQSPEIGCVGNCHHSAGGGSGGAGTGSRGSTSVGNGSSSSGGASSASSSSSASAGGSGSGSSGSTSGGYVDAGVNCPDLYLSSHINDVATLAPLAGATIAAVGLDGVPIAGAAASTAGDGSFTVCVPANVAFSLQISVQGYPATILEDISLSQSEDLATYFTHGVTLLSQNDLTVIGGFVPYNPALGAVLAEMSSYSGLQPCGDLTGWQFSLELPDGGPFPDAGPMPYAEIYLGADNFPDQTATATSKVGAAFIYGLDPATTSRVRVHAVNTNTDAGACAPIDAEVGLQETVLIASHTLSFGPVVVP